MFPPFLPIFFPLFVIRFSAIIDFISSYCRFSYHILSMSIVFQSKRNAKVANQVKVSLLSSLPFLSFLLFSSLSSLSFLPFLSFHLLFLLFKNCSQSFRHQLITILITKMVTQNTYNGLLLYVRRNWEEEWGRRKRRRKG